MRRSLHAWTILFVCLLDAPLADAANAPPSAEAFGAIPQTDDAVLSPDGNTLAWNVTTGTQQKIVVFDVTTGKDKRVQPIEAAAKLRGLHWSDDETLLVELSMPDPHSSGETRYEFFRWIALNVNSGATANLLMAGGGHRTQVTGATLLATHTPKPKTVIMSTFDWDASEQRMETGTHLGGHRRDSGWTWNLYEVDTRTGRGKLTEEGTQFTRAWAIDKDGNALAREEWNPEGNVCSVLTKRGLGWHEIFHQEKGDPPEIFGMSADGTTLLALTSLGEGNAKLVAIPLDGSTPRVLLQDPERDVEQVSRDSFTLLPQVAVLGGAQPKYYWLDAQGEKRFGAVAKAFPGKQVWLYGESQDRQRVITYVYGAAVPASFYLVDFKTHKADIIGEEYPGLAGATLGQLKVISYKARDGMEIPAYLTLPSGTESKNLPLIVLPHGGPESRDSPTFDWWAQFLATRGYAVLQPQFRGSTGFGDAFRLAGRLQWGGLMQDDVTDGVRFLTSQGIADPRRVCIVGASYGGYAALAGAAFTPDLYACAVSVNGISDLPEMVRWLEQHSGAESNTVGYWRESIGSHLEPMQAHSPRNAVDRVRASVLIMYSSNDTVVPPSQSQEMARTLTQAGKSVKLVKLEGDDHWLSNGQTRTQMLKELETFLAAQLH